MTIFHELRRRNVFRIAAAYGLVAWLLLQVVDVVAPMLDLPVWVPRGILLMLLVGFPIALLLAWAFELTPEGVKRESQVDRSESITSETGRRLDRAIIVVLLLVIGLMIVERTIFATRGEAERNGPVRSVAVLPFADLSEGGDQEWFADGLAEEILNALARAPDLLVASRTSAFNYKGSDKSIRAIGEELGVAHVLEGSVRRTKDRLRVTAQLIRAADGFHVWSENYDSSADDVIAIQENLALSIARALETTMDPEALARMLKAGTRSVPAYEHYLEGLTLEAEASLTDNFQLDWAAYDAFEKARQTDPKFSEAHARAANIWRNQMALSFRGTAKDLPPLVDMMSSFRERIRLAIETARSEVDQDRYEARLALTEMRLRDAARLFQRLVRERPFDLEVAEGLGFVAVYLSDDDLLESAVAHLYEHWEIDNEWAAGYVQFPFKLRGTVHNRDQFVERILQIMQRYPTPGMAYQVHRALLWMGEVDRARQLLPLMTSVGDGMEVVAARQACAEGRRAEAEAQLLIVDPDLSEYARASIDWHLLMLLGRTDEAVALLKPFETVASPLTVGSYLVYAQFDPQPFPMLMDIIQREGIDRPSPVPIPFACPPSKE